MKFFKHISLMIIHSFDFKFKYIKFHFIDVIMANLLKYLFINVNLHYLISILIIVKFYKYLIIAFINLLIVIKYALNH